MTEMWKDWVKKVTLQKNKKNIFKKKCVQEEVVSMW